MAGLTKVGKACAWSSRAGNSSDLVCTLPRLKKEGMELTSSKYYPHIEVISDQFEMPQLNKHRRISVLLPHDYHLTDKRYPVLYLQDGQNLIDPNAPFGNWEVDKSLARLAAEGKGDLIVVGIDHGGSDRIKEYTPFHDSPMGPGDGKKYVRFVTDTLKPWIDKHYRTLPDRLHTGIGGSSMGALISIYAGLMYPEVYSKLLLFSPSLWVSPQMQFAPLHFIEPLPSRIYLYGGGREGANMIPNIKRFKATLERKVGNARLIEFHVSIDPEGQHNEYHWGREFPRAVDWLFFQG